MRSTTRHYVSESRSDQLIDDLISLGYQYAPAPTDVESVELFRIVGSLSLVDHVYVVTAEEKAAILRADGIPMRSEHMRLRMFEAGFTPAQIEEATRT